MTPRRRQLCKPLARGSHCALARKCLKDHRVKKYVTKGFGTLLRKEISRLCSDDGGITNLAELKWNDVLHSMTLHAPTLLALLQSCSKTRRPRKNQSAIIGVLASILCKHRRPSSILQKVVSLILYTGHASKKVS